MSATDDPSPEAQMQPWQRIEDWMQGHRRHYDYVVEHLPQRRYGRPLPKQLRIEPAPADPHRVVVFGSDGTAMEHPVRGWASSPAQSNSHTARLYPAVWDRVRQTLWVPENHGQIVLLIDPAADQRQQTNDVDRLLGHLEAVDRQRRTEQTERWLAPLRQYLLQHPDRSQRLQWITGILIAAGLLYLVAVPGPGKPAVFALVVLAAAIAQLVYTTEKIRKSG